uniref:Uncharacterized protein n=1 Tax=Pithovirus LCPAC101 TaxID=2506586 RepID=A0A481Z3N4_9VIRU|nr:MAG: hypothetical protein LCPAC101_02640 [Pithovirus LCPAC101]
MGNIGVWATSSLEQKKVYSVDSITVTDEYVELLIIDLLYKRASYNKKYRYNDDIKDDCILILNEIEQCKYNECIIHIYNDTIMAIQITRDNSEHGIVSVNTQACVSNCLQYTTFGYKMINILSNNGKL